MGAHSNLLIREADASAIDNADEVAELRRTVHSLKQIINVQGATISLLRTKVRRQDGRRWSGWHEDHRWWAEANAYADEDSPTTAA